MNNKKNSEQDEKETVKTLEWQMSKLSKNADQDGFFNAPLKNISNAMPEKDSDMKKKLSDVEELDKKLDEIYGDYDDEETVADDPEEKVEELSAKFDEAEKSLLEALGEIDKNIKKQAQLLDDFDDIDPDDYVSPGQANKVIAQVKKKLANFKMVKIKLEVEENMRNADKEQAIRNILKRTKLTKLKLNIIKKVNNVKQLKKSAKQELIKDAFKEIKRAEERKQLESKKEIEQSKSIILRLTSEAKKEQINALEAKLKATRKKNLTKKQKEKIQQEIDDLGLQDIRLQRDAKEETDKIKETKRQIKIQRDDVALELQKSRLEDDQEKLVTFKKNKETQSKSQEIKEERAVLKITKDELQNKKLSNTVAVLQETIDPRKLPLFKKLLLLMKDYTKKTSTFKETKLTEDEKIILTNEVFSNIATYIIFPTKAGDYLRNFAYNLETTDEKNINEALMGYARYVEIEAGDEIPNPSQYVLDLIANGTDEYAKGEKEAVNRILLHILYQRPESLSVDAKYVNLVKILIDDKTGINPKTLGNKYQTYAAQCMLGYRRIIANQLRREGIY